MLKYTILSFFKKRINERYGEIIISLPQGVRLFIIPYFPFFKKIN